MARVVRINKQAKVRIRLSVIVSIVSKVDDYPETNSRGDASSFFSLTDLWSNKTLSQFRNVRQGNFV